MNPPDPNDQPQQPYQPPQQGAYTYQAVQYDPTQMQQQYTYQHQYYAMYQQYYQQQQQYYHQQQAQQFYQQFRPRVKQPQVSTPCVPCNKTFANEKMWQNHIQQHITCSQCSFSASKKIVKQHEAQEHGNDDSEEARLASSIRIMESPDEIARWVEERRKNYPTQANIGKKKEVPVKNKRKREQEILNKFRIPDKKQKVGSDDDDDAAPEEQPTSFEHHDNRKTRVCRYYMQGECRKGIECPFKHEGPQERKVKHAEQQQKPEELIAERILKAVLKGDIARERTKAYQAIRFIVDTNFLANYDASKEEPSEDEHISELESGEASEDDEE